MYGIITNDSPIKDVILMEDISGIRTPLDERMMTLSVRFVEDCKTMLLVGRAYFLWAHRAYTGSDRQ